MENGLQWKFNFLDQLNNDMDVNCYSMNIDETKVHNDFYKFCHLKHGDLNVLWLYPPVFIYFKHCFNIEHISLLFCEAFPKGDEILKTFAHFPNQFLFSCLKIRNLF